MKTFLFILITSPLFCGAQKIFSDKTDPFTNERTIITTAFNLKAVSLVPVLQCSASASVKGDSTQTIKLNFIVRDFHVSVDSKDSSDLKCLFKTAAGNIYKGEYVSTVKVDEQIIYTYSFSESDAAKLINEMITDLKFQGLLFQVDKNAENKIGSAFKILIDKSKT
jgi:hypothetical protein